MSFMEYNSISFLQFLLLCNHNFSPLIYMNFIYVKKFIFKPELDQQMPFICITFYILNVLFFLIVDTIIRLYEAGM